MGNAAITIHHPTSLEHGIPYLEAGKIITTTSSMIRLEKRDGTACGCGGRIQFKKTVLKSSWTYQITKETSTSFEIGAEVSVTAKDEKEATLGLAAKIGMTVSEVSQCTTLIKSVVSDSNEYSELYCYVDYEGKNCGTAYWEQNPLNLNYTKRWAEDSEMIIDITFD